MQRSGTRARSRRPTRPPAAPTPRRRGVVPVAEITPVADDTNATAARAAGAGEGGRDEQQRTPYETTPAPRKSGGLTWAARLADARQGPRARGRQEVSPIASRRPPPRAARTSSPRSPPPRPPASARSGRTTPAELGSGCLTAAHRPVRPRSLERARPASVSPTERQRSCTRPPSSPARPACATARSPAPARRPPSSTASPRRGEVPYDSWEPVPPREWDDVILRGVTAAGDHRHGRCRGRHHRQRRRPAEPHGAVAGRLRHGRGVHLGLDGLPGHRVAEPDQPRARQGGPDRRPLGARALSMAAVFAVRPHPRPAGRGRRRGVHRHAVQGPVVAADRLPRGAARRRAWRTGSTSGSRSLPGGSCWPAACSGSTGVPPTSGGRRPGVRGRFVDPRSARAVPPPGGLGQRRGHRRRRPRACPDSRPRRPAPRARRCRDRRGSAGPARAGDRPPVDRVDHPPSRSRRTVTVTDDDLYTAVLRVHPDRPNLADTVRRTAQRVDPKRKAS